MSRSRSCSARRPKAWWSLGRLVGKLGPRQAAEVVVTGWADRPAVGSAAGPLAVGLGQAAADAVVGAKLADRPAVELRLGSGLARHWPKSWWSRSWRIGWRSVPLSTVSSQSGSDSQPKSWWLEGWPVAVSLSVSRLAVSLGLDQSAEVVVAHGRGESAGDGV